MNFNIRNATIDDIDEIYKIELKSFAFPWTRGTFIGELYHKFSRLRVICETKTNQLVGFVNYWVLAEEISILNIAVDPNFRRNGIAKMTLNSIICEANIIKANRIFLEVRKSNLSAISLYEKMGFTYFGERKKYYENGETALIYVWRKD